MVVTDPAFGDGDVVSPSTVEAAAVAILLDVDGTILDIAASPRDVHLPPALARTLAGLAGHLGGALALVSGRTVADLDRIFAPLRLPAIGGHGAQTRPAGDRADVLSFAPRLDEALRRQLSRLAILLPGVLVEDKGSSIALHTRAAPQHADAVRDAVAAICAAGPAGVETLAGKAVLEVKPIGFDKGAAVRALMALPPFRGRRPIFIGDDVTDAAAFAVLPEFAGIGFSVGHLFPGLAGSFATPAEVRDWLSRLLQRWDATA